MKSLTELKPKEAAALEVYVEPAFETDLNRIWSIHRAGRLAVLPNAELGISRGDVWKMLEIDETNYLESEKYQWAQRLRHPSGQQQVLAAIVPETNKVVGMVWPHIEENVRWLAKLYVASSVRGLGVGAKLIGAAKAWHHYQSTTLKVVSYNQPAIRLYEYHGFKQVDEIADGLTVGSKPVPLTVMQYKGVSPDLLN